MFNFSSVIFFLPLKRRIYIMKDGWKNKTMWTFIGGAATALAGSKFLKSDTAHDLAVKGLAGGMKFKSDTTCKYETIKEDAKDLLEEAKVKNEG